jgi:hypothetical protein
MMALRLLSGLLVVLAILLFRGRFAGDSTSTTPKAIALACAAGDPELRIVMGRGCCSWHGGECGCSGGRDVCCDGTLSPTCSCHK